MGKTRDNRMKIGELARRTGKTVRALHLYEEMGLLTPARSDGGFRLYGEPELKRVSWIKTLQDMGFRLAQIRGLLDSVSDSASAPEAMESVRELFRERLRETRRQVEHLLKLERDIAESMAYLEACRSCVEVSAAACASCDQERHGIPEPALVAGIHLGKAPTQDPSMAAQNPMELDPNVGSNAHLPPSGLEPVAVPPGVAPVHPDAGLGHGGMLAPHIDHSLPAGSPPLPNSGHIPHPAHPVPVEYAPMPQPGVGPSGHPMAPGDNGRDAGPGQGGGQPHPIHPLQPDGAKPF